VAVRNYFRQFGRVVDAQVSRTLGVFNGRGSVTFEDAAAAARVVGGRHEVPPGRPIAVRWWRTHTQA
jgi:hypothetical protein